MKMLEMYALVLAARRIVAAVLNAPIAGTVVNGAIVNAAKPLILRLSEHGVDTDEYVATTLEYDIIQSINRLFGYNPTVISAVVRHRYPGGFGYIHVSWTGRTLDSAKCSRHKRDYDMLRLDFPVN